MWVRDIFKQREEKGAYHTLVQVTTWIYIFKICTTFVIENGIIFFLLYIQFLLKVLRLPFFFFTKLLI